MTDSSWDNSGLPPRKRGMGTGLKVALGCGVALLVAIGGCVAAVGAGVSVLGRQMQAQEWPQLRQAVAALASDEGAAALYREQPGLAADHPTEAAFLLAARGWRPLLEPLPAEPPSVFSGRLEMNIQIHNHRRSVELGHRNSKGHRVHSRWEDGRLTALRVD